MENWLLGIICGLFLGIVVRSEYETNLSFPGECYTIEDLTKALRLASQKIFEAWKVSATDEEIDQKVRMLLREARQAK